jgi:hypothetical protein
VIRNRSPILPRTERAIDLVAAKEAGGYVGADVQRGHEADEDRSEKSSWAVIMPAG